MLRPDPRDISRIWALDPDGGAYLEMPYRTQSRPPISAWEQQAVVGRLRELGRADIDESALFTITRSEGTIGELAALHTEAADAANTSGEETPCWRPAGALSDR